MKTTQITLPPDTQSPRRARRAVKEAVDGAAASRLVDMAALLVSEMVTNAVLHARSEIHLTVDCEDGSITVEVADHSPLPPSIRHYSHEAATGRGMQLVEQLADAWGTRTDADGKVVWFTLGMPTA